jgi:hypothetical protein
MHITTTRFLLASLCLASLFGGATPELCAAGALSPAFEYKDVDSKPTLKGGLRVRFPRSVRRKDEESQIVLRFIVTKEGDVTQMIVMKFSDPDMIEPAMDAYSSARFNPGVKDGVPVNTWMEVTEIVPPRGSG